MKEFRFGVGEIAKLEKFEVVVLERIEEDGELFYGVQPADFAGFERFVAEERLERID